MTEEYLRKKASLSILLVAISGCLLIATDLWLSHSSGIPVLQEDGALYLLRPEKGEDTAHIRLTAQAGQGDDKVEKTMDIALIPQGRERTAPEDTAASEENAKDRIETELRSIEAGFNDDLTSRMIPLPSALSDGGRILWRREMKTNSIPIGLACILLIVIIHRQRFQPLQKLKQTRAASVRRGLPEFTNHLVLLLGAGMVLTQAFSHTVEEQKKYHDCGEDYFYSRLEGIYRSVRHTNGNFHEEFQDFARESGVTELIRISNIITDNINKGAEMTRKLHRESEALWLHRRLRCEEEGRLAETKMTLPLSLFLCVLIVITVAPALLQL